MASGDVCERAGRALFFSKSTCEPVLGDGTAPRKLRRKPAPDQALLAKVLGMLGQSRLANNLNQIAKAANSTSVYNRVMG